MKLSQVREIYTETTIKTLPKEVRKEVFGVLKKENGVELSAQNTKKSVELVQELLDFISFLEEIFLEDGQHFSQEELQYRGLNLILQVMNRFDEEAKREILTLFKDQFKQLYPHIFTGEGYPGLFSQDNPASLLFNADQVLGRLKILRKFFSDEQLQKLDLNSYYKYLILVSLNGNYLKKQIRLTKQLCEKLGLDFLNDINLGGRKLFSRIGPLVSENIDENRNYNYFKDLLDFVGELQQIEGFNFEGILDIDLAHYFTRGKDLNSFYIDFVNYFEIKDIKELGEEAVLGAMIDGGFSRIKDIQELEEILGIKLTLEDVKKGAIRTLSDIQNYNYYEDLKKDKKLPYLKIIFETFGLGKLEVTSMAFEDFAFKLVTFTKGLVIGTDGNILIEDVLKYCEDLTGIKITGNNINDENIDTLLTNLAVELWKDQSFYKTFFTKFSNNVYINKNGEREEEEWKSDSFYRKGIHWIISGKNETENIEFINLFLDELDTIEDLKNIKIFNKFANLLQVIKQNIINFITILSRNNIIQINLESIDEDFIQFVDDTFGGSKITKNINYPKGFFDGIFSYKDFKNHGIGKLSLELEVLLENSYVYDNLKYICELYKLPISISSFRRIVGKYNNLGNLSLSNLKDGILKLYEKYKEIKGEKLDISTLIEITISSKGWELDDRSIEEIFCSRKSIYMSFIIGSVVRLINTEETFSPNFPVNINNFLENVEDENEVLFEFNQDRGIEFEGIKPWTKAWFEEFPERKEYLKPEIFKTFKKFGTIQGLMIVEGIKSKKDLERYYENTFQSISLEKSRNTILQIAESFNLILRRERYGLLNEILAGFGDKVKDFIEKYNISNKGNTIITLLIAKNIRDSFQIWKNKEGKQEVDYITLNSLLRNVEKELDLYLPIIEEHHKVDIKTSIGVEIEIGPNIAKGYKETTGGDYKQDIRILSEYSGIGEGNDAIHEIATKPTDNPALLLLELQLLEDLDFLDLNFKKPDYEKGSRGLHINIGGEYGLKLDEEANMIQNLMIMTNWGGLNAGGEIDRVNRYGKIRNRGSDVEPIFGDYRSAVEFRSLSIDKKEPLERMIFAMFKLAEAKQLKDKYLLEEKKVDLDSYEDFEKTAEFTERFKEKSQEEIKSVKDKIYRFLKLKKQLKKITEDHNKNFLYQETLQGKITEQLAILLSYFTSTAPSIKIIQKARLSIGKFKEIFEKEITTKEEFEKEYNANSFADREKEILWKTYNLKIKKQFEKLKTHHGEIYDNLEQYLNGNIDDTLRRLTNTKRFKEVIGDDENYLNSIIFNPEEIFDIVSPDFINKLVKINNLFIKKDSTNALAMYDTTTEVNGEKITSRQASETNIFDKARKKILQRSGYYSLQGASEKMLIHRVQKLILDFLE